MPGPRAGAPEDGKGKRMLIMCIHPVSLKELLETFYIGAVLGGGQRG